MAPLQGWTRRPGRLGLALALALLLVDRVQAQSTSISITGPTYNQNFDTLPNSGTFSFTGSGPFDLPTTALRVRSMAGPSTHRAAIRRMPPFESATVPPITGASGVLAAPARPSGRWAASRGPRLISSFGALFVNNTGSTLNSITITFTGEQWRRAPNANTLSFQYSVGATSIANGTFTNFSALNFTGPQIGSATALNGNLAANQVMVTATITGLNWTAGSQLAIRWNDTNDPGADAGLAIDNFSLAIPEPATVMAGLAALGLLACAFRARRKKPAV